ncbi:MAG: A/G-specific adenine glycosylase [Patescibacteria group bacterium]
MALISKKQVEKFQETIWDFYAKEKRSMPWRNTSDGYAILVSEIMLQQTQVERVRVKYEEFLRAFSTFEALATAPLSAVLLVWQGLGYNRRAKFLKQCAEIVMTNHNGTLPRTPQELIMLPGIGKGTVGSLLAFVYNRPVAFIETNIRRIFIHHFFPNHEQVSDADILPLVEATLDPHNPREWYYALMDYGTYLVRQVPNPNRKSKHHIRQSRFEGSTRQVRGAIMRELTKNPEGLSITQLDMILPCTREQITHALTSLIKDGLLVEKQAKYCIT